MKQVFKAIIFIFSMVCLCNNTIQAQEVQENPIHFSYADDMTAMREQAQKIGKPFIAYFTMDICPPCERMKKEVFSQSEVQALVDNKYLAFQINLTHHAGRQIGLEQNIQSAPTFLFFDANGNLKDRLDGATSVSNFTKLLQKNCKVAVPHSEFSDFR